MPRLALTALLVRDYDEAIAFYVRKLGFELADDVDQGDGEQRPSGTRGGLHRLGLAGGGEDLAGVGGLHLADGADVAHRRLADLPQSRTLHREQPAAAAALAVRQHEVGAVRQPVPEHPGIGCLFYTSDAADE